MADESEPDGTVPASHPRHDSLVARDRLVEGVETGITSVHGLIAHGRGEAFDYLLGERTIDSADRAARAGAASLLSADRPVISVNGNVAALAPGAAVDLATAVDAAVEVNLFHRSEQRVQAVADRLCGHGAGEVLGVDADARIPGLDHDRARVDADGIAAADVPVVDELSRALANLTAHAESLAGRPRAELRAVVDEFDPEAAIAAAERSIREGVGTAAIDEHTG